MTKLKKLSALAVLAIFIVGLLPMALAQPNGNNDKPIEKAVRKAVTSLEKAAERAEAQIGNKEGILERAKERIEAQERTVEKTQEKVEQIQAKYQAAKVKYEAAKQKYIGVKEKVNQLRVEIQECVEGECEPARKQFRIRSRDVLLHLADVVLGTLDKLKEKIELSDMTEEEIEQSLADLDAQITEVQDAKAVLETLSDDLTNEEIKDAIKVIKDAWSETKPQIKLGLGKLVGAKLGNIIVKTEQLETKFNKIRDRLEAKGQDVSSLDNYLEEFNGKLSEAKEHWETAREQFGQARNAENVGAAVREAHRHQTQAREQINDAREVIRNIVREIKGVSNLDEIEDEVEEEETEEEAEEEQEEQETEETETEE